MKKTLTALALASFLWLYPQSNGMMGIGKDTNNDGREDKREIYTMKGMTQNQGFLFQYLGAFRDYNEDGVFTEDEFVPYDKENKL